MSRYGFIPAQDCGVKKLGLVNYITAPPETCDPNCPFKNNGCYAENAPMVWRWIDQQSGKSRHSVSYNDMLIKLSRVPKTQLIRLFVAGDFARNGTGGPNEIKAREIRKVCRGKKTWGYTHHMPYRNNLSWGNTLLELNAADDFTVNISCEDETQLDQFMAEGHACVITVPSTETRYGWRTAAGNRVRVCPNQTHGVTCEQCQLCQKRPADLAIAFLGHGTRKKTIDKVLTHTTHL